MFINDNGELIVIMTNGVQKNLGVITGPKEPEIVYSKEDYFEQIKNSIEESSPTKVVTTINYYIPKYDVSLFFSSTLVIDYSKEVSTKYSYSYQKLNEISSGFDEMISTFSGTLYTKGSNIGEATNNGIKWNDVIEGSVSIFNFNFDMSLFKDEWNATEKYFKGTIIDGNETKFFVKDYDVSNVNIQIYKNIHSMIQRITVSYENDNGAIVTVNTIYTYELETITYE